MALFGWGLNAIQEGPVILFRVPIPGHLQADLAGWSGNGIQSGISPGKLNMCKLTCSIVFYFSGLSIKEKHKLSDIFFYKITGNLKHLITFAARNNHLFLIIN